MPPTVPQAMVAVSDELGMLAQTAIALQHHLSSRTLADRDVVALQSLDLLTQSLACLQAFINDVYATPSAGVSSVERALQRVSLSALRSRLAGHEDWVGAAGPSYELFETCAAAPDIAPRRLGDDDHVETD